MKEYSLLQTYEIFLKLMYLSLLKEFYMQMKYDAFGRVIKGWTPHTVKRATLTDANVDVVIEYDAMGNVITRTDKADDSSSVKTTYTYSKAGRLEEEQTDGYTIKYKYDNAGRQTEITAPDGVKTYKKYDGSGRLIEEQTGNTNAKTKYVYNPNGTLKAKIDRNGNKTEYEYDCMNQLTKESVSGLLEKTYTYDSLGRKVSENDKENNLREYSYDNLGRVIKEITPEGIELSYTYDARGNVTEYIDGRKTKFVREYTKTDLLKSEKAFDVKEDNTYGKTETALRSYVYDEGGLLEEITEGSSSIFYNEKDGVYQSDAYGNIRSMKWSSTGFEMNYEYDNLNRMTSVITPDGKEVAYTYNMNNQVTSLTGYINESITYSKSRISEYTLLNGIKKSFEYNDLGVTSSLKYNKDESIKTGFSYTYDDNFNIETRTSLDTKKLSSFDYDQANRLTNSYMEGEFESKTTEQLTTSNFSYINRDLVGTKQELVKYEALPEKIIFDTSARSYVYEFDGTKEIRAIELYPENKVHRVRERDVHIYVKENTEDAWQEVRNWKFNKDEKNGALKFTLKEAVRAGYVKVRSIWDDRNVDNKSIDDYSTFKGNANNLLRIWTLENTLTEEYSYDGNSNRVYLTENGNGFSYEYYKNTKGGNTAKVKFDGKWYYTYDSNGNRTSRAKALISGVADKNKEYWIYKWDLWNRLVKVVQYNAPDEGECVEVSYEYDVLNHRISRTTDSETTKYAYGRNGALAYQEKTVEGNVTKRSFTYLNNEIVGFTDETNAEEEKVYYTVTDIQGSITEVYDNDSNLVWKSGYTAFGELAGEVVDLIDFDGMYTGCDYDAETGLTYHWNRWRSEDGSSFISEDPARDGANWYGYAGCNPMVYVDRIGLFYYTAEGQQSSTSNTPKTDTNDSSNKTPQNQGQSIPATPDHVAGFSEQRGSYNILPKYKGIETGDKWYNSFVEGIVNYGIIGTYNLCATAINTISNGVGAAYDLINAASETVLGGDLDAITMTMMSNGMLAPAGYILNSFNTYMNGLKLANNTSKVITTALSTVQTSVNLGAGLFNIDPLPTSATKFYVAPNGDCLPSVGIKYIDSGYYDSVKSSMTLNNCSYFGFNNFDSASSAKNALQISTNWGNDCRVRVSFDTMQIFDSTFIPRGFGDTANFLEPYAACYPMLGTGGAQQYRYLGSVKLSDVTLIGE